MQIARAETNLRACAGVLAFLAALTAGFALVFAVWPDLDLVVARLFHDPATGFVLANNPFWDSVLLANKAASLIFVVAVLVTLVFSFVRRRKRGVDAARYCWFVILMYLLGPGLLVNGVAKRMFGRARPFQTALFGGDGPFTGPWQVSDYCHSACSFVSAEAAAATALTVGLVVGGLWFAGQVVGRLFRVMVPVSVVLLLLTSVQRIGSGRHFLSDVIFAVLPMAGLGVLLACLLWPRAAKSSATRLQGQTDDLV